MGTGGIKMTIKTDTQVPGAEGTEGVTVNFFFPGDLFSAKMAPH
jgi:hypothetical protein